MKHEQLQAEFYRSLEGNPYINADHPADEVQTFNNMKSANQHAFGESIRPLVRVARIARENQIKARELGVNNDDIH